MGSQYPLGQSQIEKNDPEAKQASRIMSLVEASERFFKNERLDEAVRNLAYYRGKFWEGDGFNQHGIASRKQYRAIRNEIFPIVDTIVSALAMDLPQVEALDRRENSMTEPSRAEDTTFAGRRISAVLNWAAERDELDATVQELVLNGLLFGESVVKSSWSISLGRPIWRVKMPWEVFFDPSAKHLRDAAWSFERFVLHWDDFKARVDAGVYELKRGEIRPDTFPRSLIAEQMSDEKEREMMRLGLKEYVGLIEYWDYRKNKLYHLHPQTRQILMETEVPYEKPYSILVFNNGVGRIEGISDVSLISTIQRDINELVSARREIVARLPRRMLVDEGLFNSEEDFERWKNAKTWEPVRVRFPVDGDIKSKIWVSPEMPTTFDFNSHLAASIEAIRWTPGMSDYQRGEVKNIRTAAEADMIRSAVEGRLKIRAQKLIRVVTQMFTQGLSVMRWAIRNPDVSGINLDSLVQETVLDAEPELVAREILVESVSFRLLPFSPMMEDKIARRRSMTDMLPTLLQDPLASEFNMHELGREIVDSYGWRPSVLLKDELEESQTNVVAEEEMPPEEIPPEAGLPGGADLGEIPPEVLGALPPLGMFK